MDEADLIGKVPEPQTGAWGLICQGVMEDRRGHRIEREATTM